ncbi:MAG: dihydroorotate dehydrogenase electron transfer subunit [Suipraeoptans sp.]
MQKFEETVRVISQKQISEDIFDLWVETKEIAGIAKAGQFVSLYVEDDSRLLPRPISICEIKNNTMRFTYRVTGEKTGTKAFSKLVKGKEVRIIGPLGNGFPLKTGSKALLIGGGIGIPPMHELAKERKGQSIVVAGYRDETYLEEDLRLVSDLYIATETGSNGTKGTVIDAIRENKLNADVIYACGPMPMLKAVKEYAINEGIMECYISLEEKMACGIGACLGCVCNSKDIDSHTHVNNKRVCKEGPVFSAWEVEL